MIARVRGEELLILLREASLSSYCKKVVLFTMYGICRDGAFQTIMTVHPISSENMIQKRGSLIIMSYLVQYYPSSPRVCQLHSPIHLSNRAFFKKIQGQLTAASIPFKNGVLILCLNTKPYNKIMLIEAVLAQNTDNLSAEKPLFPLHALRSKLPSDGYTHLIEWLFQTSSELQFSQRTSCMARVYFDCTLIVSQEINPNECITLMIASIALAIKVKESQTEAQKFTPKALFLLFSLPFPSDYLELEKRIVTAVGTKFRFTTPLDFLDGFIARFPFLNIIRPVLQEVTQFANVNPASCEFASEQIFFGAVLVILKTKSTLLGEIQKNEMKGMTDKWDRAERMKCIILEDLTLFTQPN